MNYNKAKGSGNDSHFEINLLQHFFRVLNKAEMSSEIRYRTSLILASLENEQINTFLTTFLTKISYEELMELCCMATVDIQTTEEFLKSNIETDAIKNIFRDFLVPKNRQVTLFK